MNFIKKFWDVLKHDIVAAVKDFEKTGQISQGCNSAFITLIPNPQLIPDFRPISLMGIIYKILSKLWPID